MIIKNWRTPIWEKETTCLNKLILSEFEEKNCLKWICSCWESLVMYTEARLKSLEIYLSEATFWKALTKTCHLATRATELDFPSAQKLSVLKCLFFFSSVVMWWNSLRKMMKSGRFRSFLLEKGFLACYTAIPKHKSEFLEVNLDTVQLESNLS